MDILNNLNSLFALIGFPTMLAGFVYVGRKLQVLDTIEYEINMSIKPDIRDLRERMTSVEIRMDSIEKRMNSMEKRMDSIEDKMKSLENRMDGFELRMGLFEKSMEALKQVAYRNAI